MNKICIISVYIGKLPHYFPLWRKSVEYNQDIDFLLATDQDIETESDNLKIIKTDLDDMKRRLERVFGEPACLGWAYKLCEYKPMFGLALKDYIEGYEWWGHCDLDLIFGRLNNFLPDMKLFDKIYELGHLTIFRNTKDINDIYKLKGGLDYREVISSETYHYFDEVIMREKCNENAVKVYLGRDYADISPRRKRFTLSYDLLTKEQKRINNFKHQVFYWENGRVYRAYIENNEIKTREFNYIHFQKRKMEKLCPTDAESFFITNEGFIEKPPGLPSVDQIYAYNKYPGKIYELSEEAVFWIGEYKKRLINKLK